MSRNVENYRGFEYWVSIRLVLSLLAGHQEQFKDQGVESACSSISAEEKRDPSFHEVARIIRILYFWGSFRSIFSPSLGDHMSRSWFGAQKECVAPLQHQSRVLFVSRNGKKWSSFDHFLIYFSKLSSLGFRVQDLEDVWMSILVTKDGTDCLSG